MVVNFYASDTRAARTMDKMSVQGVDNKEMVYKEAKISVALCPLDPTTDITSFVFTNDTIADTITINYTRNPGFISSECGCVDYSDILEIQTTHHSIKEVEVTNPSVTTVSYRADVVNAENIRIYY